MRSTRLILLLSLLASCASKKSETPKEFPAAKVAPLKISESLWAEATGSKITLKKSSLDKAFLMSMSMMTSGPAAKINVLLPKVVLFELNGTEVALLEQDVYSIYSEVPSGKVLQSFPVESQTETSVTFRWSYGLSSVPIKSSYASSDDPSGTEEQVAGEETAFPITASFLKNAEVRNNRLELRQISRIRNMEINLSEGDKKITNATKEETVMLDIAFSPYIPNPRFKPRLSTKLTGVGYFEVANVRKQKGNIDIFASRWDLSPEAGPITYAISKNAPPEAVEAMKEGVLYWNQVSQAAIGREILKVELNADPNSPPQPRRVLIYWVPYANAGSAYANFQPDPLTGEITSGVVYQTSVFYLSGKNRARRFVNRGVEDKKQALIPIGFRSASLCQNYETGISNLDMPSNDELDEKISQKAGLDYLRHVVAHEVGHTLGLRHNFAGSLGSELASPADYREKFREYLTDERSIGATITSSVMDYVPFRDCLFNGAQIAAKKAFSYDKAAIEWGYGPIAKRSEEIPLPPATPYFCTDGEMSTNRVLGCGNGDFGPKPLAGYAWELARNRMALADILIETILDGIRPDESADVLSVRQALVKNHPDTISAQLVDPASNFQRFATSGMRSIVVDRAERGQNWTNSQSYQEKTQAFLSKEFEDVGGLPGFLRTAYDLDDNFKAKQGWLVTAVREKMAKPGFGRGKTLGGKSFELTADEIRDVKLAVEKLAVAVENSFFRDILLAVTGLNPKAISGGEGRGTPAAYNEYPQTLKAYEKTIAQNSWQAGLSALVDQLTLESEGELEGSVDEKKINVPLPKFPIGIRLAGIRLLSPKVFSRASNAWAADTNQKLVQALIAKIAPVVKVLDENPDKVEPVGQISKELQDWAKQELSVLRALKAAR